MNGLDIAFLVVLLFFLIRGIFRGFIKEVTSVVAMIAAFILAVHYYPTVTDTLKPFVQNLAYRQTLSFLAIFMAIFVLVGLFGLVLDKLFKLTLHKAINAVLGGLVALLKGLVLASVVLMTSTTFVGPDSSFFQKSLAWPYLKYLTNSIRELTPPELKEAMKHKVEQLPEGLKPAVPSLPEGADQEPPPWKPAPDQPNQTPAWPGGSSNSQSSGSN
jgi:membrane protein required for colicin V production